jgi:hypothetical protein
MYYTAKVVVEFETDNGKIKKVSETYLVEASSVTHAESIVHREFSKEQRDFEVKSVTQSRYLDVFFEDATKNSNRVAIDSQNRKRSDEWPEE